MEAIASLRYLLLISLYLYEVGSRHQFRNLLFRQA
jgi:hypothetical protein